MGACHGNKQPKVQCKCAHQFRVPLASGSASCTPRGQKSVLPGAGLTDGISWVIPEMRDIKEAAATKHIRVKQR